MESEPLLIVRNRLQKWMHLLFWAMIFLSLEVMREYVLYGLCGLVFFAGGYVFLLYRFMKEPIALTVEEEGVSIIRPAIFLPWEEITGVGVVRISGNEVVGLTVHDREALWAELEAGGMKRAYLRVNSVFGYDLTVGSSAMDPEPAEVAAAIQAELLRRTESSVEAKGPICRTR